MESTRKSVLELVTLSRRFWCPVRARVLRKALSASLGRLAGILTLLMSAALMAQQGPAQPQGAQPQVAAPQQDANYRLAANDLLDFRVFQEPELDAVIRIAGDGNAIFPLVGAVPVAGKTIGEATELLRKRYMNGYLVNPQVTLTVRTYARKVFTILGQVQKPGSYEIEGSESISLLQAVGMAGGYTRIANPGNVTVKRREGGAEKVYRFNAKKMAKTESDSDFRVLPGDVITVAESIF
jgi:protein involved in polysaccharide export with SLBB domain